MLDGLWDRGLKSVWNSNIHLNVYIEKSCVFQGCGLMGQQSLLVTSTVVSGSASGDAHPKLQPLTADSRPDVEAGRPPHTHTHTQRHDCTAERDLNVSNNWRFLLLSLETARVSAEIGPVFAFAACTCIVPFVFCVNIVLCAVCAWEQKCTHLNRKHHLWRVLTAQHERSMKLRET